MRAIAAALLLVLPTVCSAGGMATTAVRQAGNAAQRLAVLTSGAVRTSRHPPELLVAQRRRLTSSNSQEPEPEQVWLVGFHASDQKVVQATLDATGGHVLHPLPGPRGQLIDHHWVVSCTPSAIKALLEAHPELTATVLPDAMKLSPGLRTAIQCLESQAAGHGVHGAQPHRHIGLSCTGKLPEPNADGTLTLKVLLPHATPEHLASLARDVRAQLLPMLSAAGAGANSPGACSDVPPPSTSHHMLTAHVCAQGLRVAVHWLAEQPRVTWVSLQPPPRVPYGLHVAAAIQDAAPLANLSQPPDDIMTGVASGLFPLWQAGLTGEGQVVGLTDFGADMDSCFLWDPAFPDYQTGNSTRDTPGNPYTPRNGASRDRYGDFQWDSYESTFHNVSVFQNTSHRKVVQYVMWGGRFDDYGHGTHTASIIAGSAYGTDPLTAPTLAVGMAPAAKLAVVHLGAIDVDPGMLYDMQRQVGARISSNSWGPPGDRFYSYDATPDCFLYDGYSWSKQDSLHIFAAGNDGAAQNFTATSGTTAIPATCKNALSVGATEGWVQNSWISGQQLVETLNPDTLAPVFFNSSEFGLPTFDEQYKLRIVDGAGSALSTLVHGMQDPRTYSSYLPLQTFEADFVAPQEVLYNLGGMQLAPNARFDTLHGKNITLVLSEPANACTALKTKYRTRGGVGDATSAPGPLTVVVVRKTFNQGWGTEHPDPEGGNHTDCSGAESLKHVRDSGAAGVLIWYDNLDTLPVTGAQLLVSEVFPAITVQRALGSDLATALTNGFTRRLKVDSIPAVASPFENVAFFSATGSAARVRDPGAEQDFSKVDVRIKPEIVAPGYVLGAATDMGYAGIVDQCTVVYRSGTSMATPVVAGGAAIVRQYFAQGFYPAGVANASHAHEASGALLKAVLLAGAVPLTGISRVDGRRVDPPPSPFQGYGRINLASSLPLQGDTRGWRLQVVDGARFDEDGVAHIYTLTVPPPPASGPPPPLIAVLSWYDYPAFPGTRYVAVNNLDLVIWTGTATEPRSGGVGPGGVGDGAATDSAGGEERQHGGGGGDTGPSGGVWWGNGQAGGDYLNNNERIVINAPAPGEYTVQVRASYLFSGARPQPYALVVLGYFTGELDSDHNPGRTIPPPA